MQPPNNSEGSGQSIEYPHTSLSTQSHRRSSMQSTSSHQPRSNPHQSFLTRTEENCPKHLTGPKRNRWLKAAKKAQRNLQLTQQLPLFHWPTSRYQQPIFVHHLTPPSIIESTLDKIRNVTVYMIDTESGPPTPFRSDPLPALLQIQAIHHQHLATVLLIETQFLPHPSTYTFLLIQQFSLFDLSQIEQHPHLPSCPLPNHQIQVDSDSDLDLICLVNTSELDDEFQSTTMIDNTKCTCPNDIRPYKALKEQWSFQKAIQFTLHEALDKTHTMNVWACGLDRQLTNVHTPDAIATRANMTLYALNDIFAPTKLLFHLNHDLILPYRSLNPLPSTSTTDQQPPTLPSFFVLSDRYTKHIDQFITTSCYTLTVHAIPGLKWRESFAKHLCAQSLIQSLTFATYFSSSTAIMFLIGTNSLRFVDAAQVIQQVAYTIDYIHHHYPNLNKKRNLSIVATSPSPLSLSSNIQVYNDELNALSNNLNFTFIDFQVTDQHLAIDQMHLHFNERHLILKSITSYVETLAQHYLSPLRNHKRSREATKRRNTIRDNKLKIKQKQFIIKRNIDIRWKPKHVKHLLKHQNIKYARLPEIHKHILTIQFNHSTDRDYADATLFDDTFNEEHFHQYFSAEH